MTRRLWIGCVAALAMLGACGQKLEEVLPIPAFNASESALSIRLSFDGKASAYLLEHGGKLAADAIWYARASETAKARLPAGEADPLVLARQSQSIDPVGQTLMLRGEAVADRMKTDLVDGVVRLRVSFRIVGAPPDSPEITCGVVDDAVAALKRMPSEALCGFAAGDAPAEARDR